MNITPHVHNTPVSTVANPPTDSLRRDNNLREAITKTAAVHPSAAEKSVASERERAKAPAQNNESIDFSNLRKQANQENSVINDGSSKQENREQSNPEQNTSEQGSKEKNPAEVFAEEQEIKSLKQRDKEVRTHELAHASAGGAATGAPSYTFEVGPDGKKYAVGGEVSVDLSTVDGNPRATIAKMQKVHAAALAPANPSTQDTRVAAAATQIIMQAQAQLAAMQNEKPELTDNSAHSNSRQEGNLTEDSSVETGSEFDTLINKTLKAQDSPNRPSEIDQRALRIENFYLKINQAYEQAPSYQFQLSI